MEEQLELDGRMSVRSPMQWSTEPNAGFTTAERPFRPIAPGGAEVASQRRHPDSLLNWFERLIRRRKECPELGWGTCTLLDAGQPSVLAHRSDWDGSTVVAVHNLGGRRVRPELELEDAEDGSVLVDLFDHDERRIRDGRVKLELPRYGARWYRLRRPGQRIAP
jgi:maltose alpha-D-glucosyltransferase/alpha-amylase